MRVRWFVSLFLLLALFLITPFTSSAAVIHSAHPHSTWIAHRMQPVTAMHPAKPHSAHTTNIQLIPCGTTTAYQVDIQAVPILGTQQEDCFAGTGYMGLGNTTYGDLYDILWWYAGAYCGWFRVYDAYGNGANITFTSYTEEQQQVEDSYYLFDKVTQVDIEGTDCMGHL